MASAREYFRMKQSSLREEEYSSQLRSHRRKRFFRVFCIILAVILAAMGYYIYSNNRTYDNYEMISDTKREDDDSTIYLEYLGNMLKYNMDGIACVDKDNTLIWNQPYEMKDPMVDIYNEYVSVCDNGGNKVYIFNKEGVLGEVDTKFPIKKMCVSGKGTVAVLMQEEEINYIDYYNKNGKLIAENKAPVEKPGFPLDISLSQDGYKLAVSYMIIENASIQTKLAFYNFDSVGENEIDHLVAAANYENEIIPKVKFLTEDTAVVFGTDFWEIYQGTQKPKSIHKETLSEEIKSVFYDDKCFGLIYKNNGKDNPYEMKVYNLKGKPVFEKSFGFEYDNVFVKDSYIYMQNSAGCQIYNMKGKLIYDAGYEDELQSIIPVNKRKKILVFSNRVLYMRLK